MAIEKYLVESVREMYRLLIQSDLETEENRTRLLEAAAVGCRTLMRLCDDPDLTPTVDQFADVRIIATFIQKDSARARTRERKKINEFRSIIEDPANFEMFLELEREVLLKGGVPAEVTELLLEASLNSIEEIRTRAKPPSEIIDSMRLLRDRACVLSRELKAKAIDERRWDAIKGKIKKTTVGVGGAALIGLNASALAASVGITTVGSAVSLALGGAILSAAAADLAKTRAAGR